MEKEEKTSLSLSEESTKNKLRTLFLEGKELKEILAILEIPKGTFDAYYYNNKYALRDFMLDTKRAYMIQQAEAVSKKILSLNTEDNAKMLAIQQKEAEFLRETQGKDLGYSKRIETIGLNINKNEPLDEDQKEKLNQLLKASGQKPIKKQIIHDITLEEDNQATL
jgi:hypothetical protein